MQSAQSTITRRWQTVIPAQMRAHLQVNEGDKLIWLYDGQSVRVVRLPVDPVKALRGNGRGERLVERLLAERAREKQHAR